MISKLVVIFVVVYFVGGKNISRLANVVRNAIQDGIDDICADGQPTKKGGK